MTYAYERLASSRDTHAHWEPYHMCFREGSKIKWLGARRMRPISAPQAKKILLTTCSFTRFYTIFRARTVLHAPPEATKKSLLPLPLLPPLLLWGWQEFPCLDCAVSGKSFSSGTCKFRQRRRRNNSSTNPSDEPARNRKSQYSSRRSVALSLE